MEWLGVATVFDGLLMVGGMTGESPSMLFNLVMTRFEDDYNPYIIYDASCLAKEYGYNRGLYVNINNQRLFS